MSLWPGLTIYLLLPLRRCWADRTIFFLVLRRREPEMDRPFRAGRGPIIGIIAVILSAGIASQYLPGMPSGLGVPEWIIVGIWTVVGVVFAFRMDVPEYNPEL